MQQPVLTLVNTLLSLETLAIWSSVQDGSFEQMRCWWWRVGQSIGLLFILPLDAGQPLIVLPQMLFPRGDDEEFHKAVRCLTISMQSPLHRSGAQSRLVHPAHR